MVQKRGVARDIQGLSEEYDLKVYALVQEL